MTPRTEAIAYRIWGYASPRGWDVTVAQICDALSVSASVVGAVLQAKGWHSRVRAGIDRYSGLSSAGGAMLATERHVVRDMGLDRMVGDV